MKYFYILPLFTVLFIEVEPRNRRVWFSQGNNFRKCEEPYEERLWCAPMRKCRACGFKSGGVATTKMQVPGSIPMQGAPMMAPMNTMPMIDQPMPMGGMGYPAAGSFQTSAFVSGAPVITSQPMGPGAPPPPPGAAVQWMEPPPQMPGVPPGLEYLTQIDKLVINQHMSLLEIMVSWEVKNKYSVFNSAGQQVFFAFEESDVCERQCCGPLRGYTMHVVDNFNREVMRFTRPFKCLCDCGCCAGAESCATETTIEAPPGNVVSVVRQTFGCCCHNFVVNNADESKEVFKIEGPGMCGWTYNCNCCADKVYEILLPDDSRQVIGSIRKKWRGFIAESYTNADVFTCEFPIDLEVTLKAALFGATFLIDFLAFEQQKRQNNNF
ncbi:unnamed protein product, partial [Mesorhabditis belari]|uniref:Phospholipid scramblase n=1 Tax=Mesorhabditis belari TaxID=2138241 RepID=A0AAF3ENY9_9BILA